MDRCLRFFFDTLNGGTKKAQNLDKSHALGGLISMATDGAVKIQGGNFQIFEQFLEHSSANVYLNTPVWINTLFYCFALEF